MGASDPGRSGNSFDRGTQKIRPARNALMEHVRATEQRVGFAAARTVQRGAPARSEVTSWGPLPVSCGRMGTDDRSSSLRGCARDGHRRPSRCWCRRSAACHCCCCCWRSSVTRCLRSIRRSSMSSTSSRLRPSPSNLRFRQYPGSLGQFGWKRCHCSGARRIRNSSSRASSCVTRPTSSRRPPRRWVGTGGRTIAWWPL